MDISCFGVVEERCIGIGMCYLLGKRELMVWIKGLSFRIEEGRKLGGGRW